MNDAERLAAKIFEAVKPYIDYVNVESTTAELDADLQQEIAKALRTSDLLEQAGRMREWRPIETAPTDGMEILLYALAPVKCLCDMGLCYWSDDMKAWTCGWSKEFLRPTHWRPLPEPPEALGITQVKPPKEG